MLAARLRVILTAAPTYILIVAFVVRSILEETAQYAGLPAWVAGAGAAILAVCASAVAILQRVTPVLTGARGLLPPVEGTPVTAREAHLARELERARTEFP